MNNLETGSVTKGTLGISILIVPHPFPHITSIYARESKDIGETGLVQPRAHACTCFSRHGYRVTKINKSHSKCKRKKRAMRSMRAYALWFTKTTKNTCVPLSKWRLTMCEVALE